MHANLILKDHGSGSFGFIYRLMGSGFSSFLNLHFMGVWDHPGAAMLYTSLGIPIAGGKEQSSMWVCLL